MSQAVDRAGGRGPVDPDFADLVPLFVSEARARLEHLATLAERAESDGQAAVEARRELHTLKGAGRMLRLAPLAELCHAAEGVLQSPAEGMTPLLTRILDRLGAMVDAVAAGQEPVADQGLLEALGGQSAAASRPPAASVDRAEPAARSGQGAAQPADSGATGDDARRAGPASAEVRVASDLVDALADRATRLRILALTGSVLPGRLLELVNLAEQGVHDPHPGQALAVLAVSLRRLALDLEQSQRQLRRGAEDQLEAILALQIQPLRSFFHTLARHARELARSLGREVDVVVSGEDTRLDSRIVRGLEDALLHLLRNAVDHGIESASARTASGKSPIGRIRLEAAPTGARVRLVVSDDGAGVDPVKVAQRAVELGLIDQAAARAMSREETLRLLFTPGFSTRDEVSEISGRGVGLDAVAAAVARLGGSVVLTSQNGKGSTVVVEVPAALRGELVTVAGVGRLRIAIPSSLIRQVHRLPATDVIERNARPLAKLGERMVPFVPLAEAFGETPRAEQMLLEGSVGGQTVALAIDVIENEEEVLVRPMTRVVASHPLIDGVALLASGQPVGVLSAAALVQREPVKLRPRPASARPAARLRVLLVDDSMVTREMERRLLEDAGFEVVAAGDAAEALTHLSEQTFQCVVTDVEMPGMDGLELTRRMRSIPHLAQLPVLVVSTRDRPEDRLRGLEAGADAYLTKQGLDATELVQLVRRLGGT